MKNKSFLLSVFYAVSILFSLLIAFNYFFDSYGFFKKNRTIDDAARAIANQRSITGLQNYDERIFQKKVFQNFLQKPKCIVLGSSRSMMIESKMVPHNRGFFNHSVSGASIEDHMAIIALYEKNKALPNKVILSVDPWLFNKNNNQTRWKSLKNEYEYALLALSHAPTKKAAENNDKNIYWQLINYENTKNNLLNFQNTLHDKNTLKIISDEDVDAMIKRGDGSIAYPFKIRHQNDTETLKLAKSYCSAPIYSVENFNELSNTSLFEQLITHLQNNGVEVVLFLPPYHPIAYRYFLNHPKYKYVLEAETYLQTLSHKQNIPLFGSYNPDLYGLTSTDFTDGMHAKTSALQKILQK
ncbi:DUF1574 family protein [Sulfuricurvum sp.]|uniref:DUF1574 family protein n=1 Tax=Sulfuricurvum sp. TaxID=2025608 RepID=UPI002E340159|nr:DUF1574 family protein [Sulfuricurvum sp.]HEX5330052.1 DUF1574 family protein [Sulfuricurvum sp.]